MLILPTLFQTHIIFDACCLINLDQAAIMGPVLRSLGKQAVVAKYVARKELRRLHLDALVQSHELTITDVVTLEEKLDWFSYAGDHDLEEGEAITGAIARSRGWIIATDERKAVDCFAKTIPGGICIGTPDLLYHWSETTQPNVMTLRQVLKDIETKGHYYPGVRHPLHHWWVTWTS